jgi:hypothetical protein
MGVLLLLLLLLTPRILIAIAAAAAVVIVAVWNHAIERSLYIFSCAVPLRVFCVCVDVPSSSSSWLGDCCSFFCFDFWLLLFLKQR